jgi:hypothetical protein
MLAKNDALFEVTAIDLSIHDDSDLVGHRAAQAEGLTSKLTDEHRASLVEEIWELRRALERMPIQLYVQSTLTFELVKRIVEHGTLYWAQRAPRELGAFHWVIDAKDKQLTQWERWWSLIVMPSIQSKSLRKPLPMMESADYSYLERFMIPIPEYLKPHIKDDRSESSGLDFGKVLRESFRFSPGREPGLELADIVVNATRRALIGNLALSGWRNIPRLMIHRKQQYIHFVALMRKPPARRPRSYAPVLRHFHRNGKSMIAPRFLAD